MRDWSDKKRNDFRQTLYAVMDSKATDKEKRKIISWLNCFAASDTEITDLLTKEN